MFSNFVTMIKGVINIEPHDCSECYRCIRVCQVKAIEVVDNQTKVREDECTQCGECLSVCPHDMITLRQDKDYVRRVIKRSDRVVVSLHWSWSAEFGGVEPYRMVEALRLLGFSAVSEMTLGSEYYEELINEEMHRKPRLMLGTECPVAVTIIRRRYPKLIDSLGEIASPAILHSRMLKNWYGNDTKIVHITPCVAMKSQSDNDGEIDAVLTFRELREWMWDDGVEFDFIPGNESYKFEPHMATHKRGATIERFYKHITFAGFNRINSILSNLTCTNEPLFLELWGCSGGCFEGVGATQTTSLIDKELLQRHIDHIDHAGYSIKRVPSLYNYCPDTTIVEDEIAKSQIERALREIGKFRPADYHNCNACGYESCRDFARAMVVGKSESSMCMSYSRNLAQKKFTALLDKMPSGVMLVDHNLKIIEANQNVANILGADAQLIYGANRGMGGADLEKLITFTPLLSGTLAWNKDKSDEEVQIGEKMYRVSVFSIEPHRVICVVINQALRSEALSEEMTRITKEVIRENLEAVQKIAHLLGETASRTEAVLNSIIEQR